MLHQGFYKVLNKNKYIGNPDKVIYRSSWEKRLCMFFDNCNLIKFWSSEENVISYKGIDNKIHNYFIDFFIQTINGNKYLLEVKPLKKTRMPSKKSKKYLIECQEFIKNQLKFEAGSKHALSKGMKYIIITEKILKPEFSDSKLNENLKTVIDF